MEQVQPEQGKTAALQEHARTMVVSTDAVGTIQFATGDGLRQLGRAERELLGQSVFELFGSNPVVANALKLALAGTDQFQVALVGSVTFELRLEPRTGDDGGVVGCLLLGRECAPPASTLAALQSSDVRLRLLFRQIPGALWVTDKDLRITYAVGRLRERFQELNWPLVGRGVRDIAATESADEQIILRHLAAFAGQSSHFRYTFRARTYEIQIEPLRDEDSAIIGCIGIGIDVTERLEAEAQWRRTEAMLQNAQRAAHIGSWEWDVSSNTVTWSEELFSIYGLTPSEPVRTYEEFLSHVHPDDLALTRNTVLDAYRRGTPFAFDHRVLRPDGSVRMLHTRGNVVTDEAGKPVSMRGSCLDMTPRWQAEQELQRTVSLLRATLDSTADGLLVVDQNGRVTIYNQRFLTLWRIPAELAARGDEEAMLRVATEELEDPESFDERVRQLYEHRQAESLDVLRFKDGRVFERYSQPQRLGGEPVGRVWSFRDVTERERLLRSAILVADASRLLASLDIEKALDAMARITIPTMGEACAIDLFTDEGGPRRLLSVSRAPMPPVAADLPRSVLSGHSLTYTNDGSSFISVPLLSQGNLLGVLTFGAPKHHRYADSDLTLAEELAQRTALALENARLFRRANEALAAREEFLSVAAHELRGPVTAQHLAVQTLKKGGLSSQASARALEIIEREDRRIARFVSELLDVSRVRKEKLHFDFEEVDLAEVTRDVISRLASDLTQSGSSLSLTSDAAVVGYWDRSRLDQVVTNLLANAIKFGMGKPIEVTLKQAGNQAVLSVHDQGIGIQEEKQQQIFEPFERAVSGRYYGGLGLGLYIVRTIVEGLGGSIRVQSKPGVGATFVVELPRSRRA